MVISKKILALIERKHNIKLTDEQAEFLGVVYAKRIRPDWSIRDFAWGVFLAVTLFPAPDQHPEFVHSPFFEQLKLDSFDDFSG